MRLLHRTTHGLSLTDEGDTFLSYARRLLDTTAEPDNELSGKLSGLSGWVRVSVSPLHPDLRGDAARAPPPAQDPRLHRLLGTMDQHYG